MKTSMKREWTFRFIIVIKYNNNFNDSLDNKDENGDCMIIITIMIIKVIVKR